MDIQGRKIFFLYPTPSVQNQIIAELAQDEFEVYAAKDHGQIARILKKYPDSIVFANIDEGMPKPDWEKWVRSLMNSQPEVAFGVFSNNNDEELKIKYLDDLNVTCGYTFLKLDMSKSIPKILDYLKTEDAKGRRKYIRVTIENEPNMTLNLPHDGEYINGSIKDISVIGVSCVFDSDPDLTKNALFKNIQLRLQSTLLKVEAIAYGSRIDGDEKIYVFLFTQRVDPEVRTKIRRYIQQNLQSKMDIELKKI